MAHRLYSICEVVPAEGTSKGTLCVYVDHGADEGIYMDMHQRSAYSFEKLRLAFNADGDEKWGKEFERKLRELADQKVENEDDNLVFMNDVILNYATKEFIEFTPDIVRTSKAGVKLGRVKPATKTFIRPDGSIWDIWRGLAEIQPDPDTRRALLQIIGGLLRNYVHWHKLFVFIGEGANGKSTVISICEGMAGASRTSHLTFQEFGDSNKLVDIVGKSLNVSDENDGRLVSTSEKLRAIIVNSPVTLRRLYEQAFSYKPHLFHIQAMNDMVQFREKNYAMDRRFEFMGFSQTFADTPENKMVADVYMKDPEVLTELAWHVLMEMPNYYEVEPSAEMEAMRTQYKVETDPVVRFWHAVRDEIEGPFLPVRFLFDWFKAWAKSDNPGVLKMGIENFRKRLMPVMTADGWEFVDQKRALPQWFPVAEEAAVDYANRSRTAISMDMTTGGKTLALDPADKLAMWLLGDMPKQDKLFVLPEVLQWCTAHGTKPKDFLDGKLGKNVSGRKACYGSEHMRVFRDAVASGAGPAEIDFSDCSGSDT